MQRHNTVDDQCPNLVLMPLRGSVRSSVGERTSDARNERRGFDRASISSEQSGPEGSVAVGSRPVVERRVAEGTWRRVRDQLGFRSGTVLGVLMPTPPQCRLGLVMPNGFCMRSAMELAFHNRSRVQLGLQPRPRSRYSECWKHLTQTRTVTVRTFGGEKSMFGASGTRGVHRAGRHARTSGLGIPLKYGSPSDRQGLRGCGVGAP